MTKRTRFQRPRRANFGAGAALLMTLSSVHAAHASPAFPGEVQAALGMPCVPQCTLCHLDTNGGKGTIVRPFGQAMMAVGLESKRPELVAAALDTLEQASTDSDGDGFLDVEELREGKNPNQPGEGVLCATYGCGMRASSPAGSRPAATLFFLIASAFVARVRSRPPRTHQVGATK